jgi:hypothetical protein
MSSSTREGGVMERNKEGARQVVEGEAASVEAAASVDDGGQIEMLNKKIVELQDEISRMIRLDKANQAAILNLTKACEAEREACAMVAEIYALKMSEASSTSVDAEVRDEAMAIANTAMWIAEEIRRRK